MTMIPHTEWERLELLKEIERGDKVVIPTSPEHARFMIMIAQAYLKDHQDEMMDVLKR